MLEVSRSGYYAWLNRDMSQRAKENEELKQRIFEVFKKSNQTYGSPRIYRYLAKEGFDCSENRVARLMRELGIKAKQPQKFKTTTDSNHNLPVQDNILDRNFDIDNRNEVWAGDITYIDTQEGWLYLAVVIDLYSRKVIGWAMSDSIDKELVIDALDMALKRRTVTKGLIFHSDRGSQYASHRFQEKLWENNIISSMSRKGDCWDNAVVESFFGTLKTELTDYIKYEMRSQARRNIFEYIEIFYNQFRLHSGLNYKSPKDYEKQRKTSKLCV